MTVVFKSNASFRKAVPGDVFDSTDTLLYNQSFIVYAPDTDLTRKLMEAARGHPAFDHFNSSPPNGGFVALPNETAVDALFEENSMLYAAVIFHESESLDSKVRL